MSNSKSSVAALALIVLALLGIADGVYLTVAHIDYELGHRGVQEVCHQLTAEGCAVTAGRFGDIRGIPVATIGFAGMVTTAVLGVFAFLRRRRHQDPTRSVLLLLAAGSVAASLLMGVFSLIEDSFCPFCLMWYAVNAGIFAAAWAIRDKDITWADRFDDVLGNSGLAAVAIFSVALIAGTFAHGARRDSLLAEREQALEENAAALAAEDVTEALAKPQQTFHLDNAPRKGPQDAEVTIVEFGDFECPHCRKLWTAVEAYYAKTDRKVAVVWANFPLDATCNPRVNSLHGHACAAAIAAACAQEQDKFWEYGDQLFANQDALEDGDLLAYADAAGLDRGKFQACKSGTAAKARVQSDGELGMRINIQATPTFFVNGYEFVGPRHPAILEAIVEQLLEK